LIPGSPTAGITVRGCICCILRIRSSTRMRRAAVMPVAVAPACCCGWCCCPSPPAVNSGAAAGAATFAEGSGADGAAAGVTPGRSSLARCCGSFREGALGDNGRRRGRRTVAVASPRGAAGADGASKHPSPGLDPSLGDGCCCGTRCRRGDMPPTTPRMLLPPPPPPSCAFSS
jgi:hypothetical protein